MNPRVSALGLLRSGTVSGTHPHSRRLFRLQTNRWRELSRPSRASRSRSKASSTAYRFGRRGLCRSVAMTSRSYSRSSMRTVKLLRPLMGLHPIRGAPPCTNMHRNGALLNRYASGRQPIYRLRRLIACAALPSSPAAAAPGAPASTPGPSAPSERKRRCRAPTAPAGGRRPYHLAPAGSTMCLRPLRCWKRIGNAHDQRVVFQPCLAPWIMPPPFRRAAAVSSYQARQSLGPAPHLRRGKGSTDRTSNNDACSIEPLLPESTHQTR